MVKKAPRKSTGGASGRRLSLGGATIQTPKPNPAHSAKVTPHSRAAGKNDGFYQNNQLNHHDSSFTGISAGKLLSSSLELLLLGGTKYDKVEKVLLFK